MCLPAASRQPQQPPAANAYRPVATGATRLVEWDADPFEAKLNEPVCERQTLMIDGRNVREPPSTSLTYDASANDGYTQTANAGANNTSGWLWMTVDD
ncbi:hypothetical protein Airi01_080070 [Actinoallomurus iriomotensis]|uniref:Uncharacterized protein n=1 Tax=Actinoallomurus iriomotensis TaxID=478107 RepID=A0A9W6RQP1_9ACTN|nr:hypothetical protein Airi01_080070 [Actinoallomurus iriomotensis]